MRWELVHPSTTSIILYSQVLTFVARTSHFVCNMLAVVAECSSTCYMHGSCIVACTKRSILLKGGQLYSSLEGVYACGSFMLCGCWTFLCGESSCTATFDRIGMPMCIPSWVAHLRLIYPVSSGTFKIVWSYNKCRMRTHNPTNKLIPPNPNMSIWRFGAVVNTHSLIPNKNHTQCSDWFVRCDLRVARPLGWSRDRFGIDMAQSG